ncbi:MAG: tripartite tricarboxylate transporter substrate binding protein [Pseudomonadota bacterium]
MKRTAWISRRLVAALALGALASAGMAQTPPPPPWSAKPIRLVVGATAGGTTDLVARVVGKQMGEALGTQVIVENRDGAGGNIAADLVARSAPDGHTLLMSYSSHTINAGLFPRLPFDPVRDFTAVSMVATAPALLVTNPQTGINSVAELIAYAKKNPGKLSFGIGGVGSSLQMATEQFRMMTAADIVNVPYKGTAPAVADLLGGHVQMMFSAIANVLPHIKSGKIKLIAVTGPQRMKEFPDVPTVAETVPGFESLAWWGVFGPAHLPAPVLASLNTAIVASLATPEVQARFAADALDRVGDSPKALSDFVVKDVARWKRIVKATGAKPE